MMAFAFPEQAALARAMGCEPGEWEWRRFPDGESYVRVASEVAGREVTILCSLNQPDAKTLPLIFLARTLKELGASKVTLVAPYLGYMRQDARFHPGEAVTSGQFAALLSPCLDRLVTIDPHLHRHRDLSEIYACECRVLSAATLMAEWIRRHISQPLLIGPDAESEQWVREVAQSADAPYAVLEKTRHGDRDVRITLPDLTPHAGRMPVLVDDIISTAGTMIKAIALLQGRGFPAAACLATHGLFAAQAYEQLQQSGASHIVTANTIPHPSNALEITSLLAGAGLR